MKKVRYFMPVVIALLSMLFFVSCEKEGEFNPKEKISKIYKQEIEVVDGELIEHEKSLSLSYEWDDDLLKALRYHYSSIPCTTYFEYEKDRLVRLVMSQYECLQLHYDGNKLEKAEYLNTLFEEDIVIQWEEYEYEGSKLSRVTYHYPSEDHMFTGKNRFSLLELMLPDHPFKSEVVNSNEPYLIHEFEWDGDNISKMTRTSDPDDPYYTEVYEYEYDDMANPYYKSLHHGPIITTDMQSKNNFAKITFTNSHGTATSTYEYEYENGFPVKRICTSNPKADVIYYEYE